LSQKKPTKIKGGGVAQGVSPEFKTTPKKKPKRFHHLPINSITLGTKPLGQGP
jgi:hypothetical protein